MDIHHLKEGDVVKIKSIKWYNKNKNRNGDVDVPYIFTEAMSEYCGEKATVGSIKQDYVILDIDYGRYKWSLQMLESPYKSFDLE